MRNPFILLAPARVRRRAAPSILAAALLIALVGAARSSIADVVATAATAAAPDSLTSDPQAIAIADEVMKALGGKARWDSLRGLRWSFGFEENDTVRVTRRHAWDKHSGWHRVEGTNRAGQGFYYIENLNDSTGRAWIAGSRIEGDSLKKLLKVAKRMWTNDTYWMLMPYKLRDPGVILKYAGEARDGAKVYDKVALSFDHVGQTPGDHYWIYVDRASHRIEKWDYLLENQPPPPDHATWEGWEEHGGLWFPTAHRKDKGNVFTRDVHTVTTFKPTEFTAP